MSTLKSPPIYNVLVVVDLLIVVVVESCITKNFIIVCNPTKANRAFKIILLEIKLQK